MPTISFAQLADFLPRGDRLTSKKLPEGLEYPGKNPRFVEPDLRVEKAIEPNKTSIILLAAPGAVGKSTLASELAARKGAALWDLSQVQVGSKTFQGTIMEAYDFEATGVQKGIRDGNFLFVLDALDEAQVRAGSQNFDAFLDDLVASHKAPRAKPTAVLLARLETADWIHLVFDDNDVPFARYTMEFFDYDRAVDFIGKKLDEIRTENERPLVHRQQVQPYKEAFSLLFGRVYSLFGATKDNAWKNTRVVNFLGYAPVLEVLAEYLDVNNYKAFQEYLGTTPTDDPWEFLRDIVVRLLKREQQKVQKAIKGKIIGTKLEWSEWECFYEAEEQCARVLGRILDTPPASAGPKLPPAVSALYEEALEMFLPQHVFLAGIQFSNVVFKEYVYAWGVLEGDQRLASALRASMHGQEQPFLPSQMYSHFVAKRSSEETLLDGRDFGGLYESSLARDARISLNLLQTNDIIHGILTISTEDDEHELSVQLLDTGAGVHLWRRLNKADIEVKGSIRFGLPSQRFVLGPGVDLKCGHLIVACEEVDVDASEEVRLTAGTFTAEVQPTRLRLRNESETSGNLAVYWPDVAHPWASHRSEPPQESLALTETLRGDTLRRFLMMFRRQRTRKERTLQNTRWSEEQAKDRDDLIELALSKGVLKRLEGLDTFLFDSKFDTLKSLVGEPGRLSPLAEEFVREYLGDEQAERVIT